MDNLLLFQISNEKKKEIGLFSFFFFLLFFFKFQTIHILKKILSPLTKDLICFFRWLKR